MRTVFILIISIIFANNLFAQEVQVSPDKAGKFDYITTEMESRLNLFPQYKNFLEARLYELSDSTYLLEILHRKNGQRHRERKKLTTKEFREFRRQVSEKLQQHKPETMLNQEGRAKLLTATSLIGLTRTSHN